MRRDLRRILGVSPFAYNCLEAHNRLRGHDQVSLGAAARRRRSLMASPRPSAGMAITAIAAEPAASSSRNSEKRLAAASRKFPNALRLRIVRALSTGGGPKA